MIGRKSALVMVFALAGCTTDPFAACDDDGDGFIVDGCRGLAAGPRVDCAEGDETVFPDAPEACDAKDNDCDGDVDERPDVGTEYFDDGDGDGFGDPGDAEIACAAPEGAVDNADDCDDGDPDVGPHGIEACNGADDDCDGDVDESGEGKAWYADVDGDAYGDDDTVQVLCAAPDAGWSLVGGDCDDENGAIHPWASEIWYDGIDQDCDDGDDFDADEDGYAAREWGGGDCDDAMDQVNPGVSEVCNDHLDNDCDETDNGCAMIGTVEVDFQATTRLVGAAGPMSTGHVDGDSTVDLLVTTSQAAYLFTGGVESLALDEADATFLVGEGDPALTSGTIAGDLNGDYYWDIALGSAEAGEVHLFYGPTTGEQAVTLDHATLIGPSGDGDGYGAAVGLGYVDDWWNQDLVVGRPGDGDAQAFYGYTWGPWGDTAWDTATIAVSSPNPGESFGAAVLLEQDVDGDFWPDVVIGEPGGDDGAGRAWVFRGPVQSTASHADGVVITGATAGDRIGRVLAAGDLNDDDVVDLVLGSPTHDGGSGAVWIVPGPIRDHVVIGDGTIEVAAAQVGEEFGTTVGVADVNGDAEFDLVVGAPRRDIGGNDTGAVYVFYGPLSGPLIDADDADLRLVGPSGAGVGRYLLVTDVIGADKYAEVLIGDSVEATWVIEGRGL